MEKRVLEMRSRMPRLLLVVVLALLAFLLSYLLLSSYQDQIRKAEVGVRNLAAILETQLYATLRRADADLLALSSEIPIGALNAKSVAQYQQELHGRLVSRLIHVEQMDGFHVFDANGVALYSSHGMPAPVLDISDRAYFRTLRDDPDAGLVFSSVVRSGFSGNDILVVARGIRDERGKFTGVVISPLDLDSYKRQFDALNIGEKGFVALMRLDNRHLMVRWPENRDEVNRPLGVDHPFVKALAGGASDVAVRSDSGVGPSRISLISSLKKMPDYPFYFVVSFDRDEVLAGWFSQIVLVGLVLSIVVALVSVLLLRLGRMRTREAVILTDLAQSESQFSDLAQLVPVGISRFDLSGKCTFVNDRYKKMTGRSREDLIGSEWPAFVHAGDLDIVNGFWERKNRDGEVCVCEYRIIRPNGESLNVTSEIKPERDLEGVVRGYIVAQTDITQQKSVEAELLAAKRQAEQDNQAKTRFLATASHDLRQPIQAINLFKDALSRTGLNDEQKTIARFLSLSVRSLSDLLYALLDFSKLDAGMVYPQMRRVDVEDVFKAVDEEFSSYAQQRKLRFKFFYPFNGLALYTDPGLLLSVLRNLIDNAFKYTNLGGVLVGVRRRRGRGVVQVWDTGMGIDPLVGDKVFEECFQVGNPAKDRAKGLGIGLSIARRTARLLGGDVVFHSRPGRGAVFEIDIPLFLEACSSANPAFVTKDRVSPSIDDISYARFKGARVVVVEDDPVVAKSIELSLLGLGMQVNTFFSAEEALASPVLLGADFYISDFILPGMNGIQLLDYVQKLSVSSVNAVLMTGEVSPDRMELIKSSRWTVLFKPADLSDILSIMSEVVDAQFM